jgi:TonB-linked SusC/RagA family outer membrane protein
MKKNIDKSHRGMLLPFRKLRGSIFLVIFTFIVLQSANAQRAADHRITGSVVSAADGSPLAGVSVRIGERNAVSMTDKDGKFIISSNSIAGVLRISLIGYRILEVPFDLSRQQNISARLFEESNPLDEVQIVAYGTTTKRFNTGSVVTIKSSDIEKQPVSNPLAALAGRVPGMMVTQSDGTPRSTFDIQIRGQNSISQGNSPLVNQGSPLSNLNPMDIERMEILKDADATAIYGSRGANGVLLITTKKGRSGGTKIDASINQGIAKVSNRISLLNTEQYLAMRNEAFENDEIEPTAINAPDLMLWDKSRYTDWQEYLIGGTARSTTANISLSGGDEQTQFHGSASYNRQGTVYPGEHIYNRGTVRLNVTHSSVDKRFKALLSAGFGTDRNELPGNDLTASMMLPPNNPLLFDDEGNLNWEENGGTFSNPLTYLKRTTYGTMDNLLTNVNLQYELFKGFQLKTNLGYSQIQFNRLNTNPISAQNPTSSSPLSSAVFNNTAKKSFIAEPQIEYSSTLGAGKIDVLVGTSIQSETGNLITIEASDFPNDAVIESAAFAKDITAATSKTAYRYQALFGRINYNYAGKYLLNLTGRRDGSSRFGPDKRIANFGAVGGAWVFSEELKTSPFFKWLDYGKFRGSYGITGNDQVGDYQYLDDYEAVRYAYQDAVGYIPSRLYNADYTWERNRKLEFAVELGFFGNRVQLTSNWFRNRSDNQLIQYRLPNQVGFSSILRNFGALVENTGWEWMLSTNIISKGDFNWSASTNLTINRNELLEFEGLASSSYANSLAIGEPLNIQKYLQWTGVNPETGLHMFEGTSKPADQTVIADYTPRFYGGVSSDLSYKNWTLGFLFHFVKQQGINHLTYFSGNTPGNRNNQPTEVLDRWRHPGDLTTVQRFTTGGDGSIAFTDYARYSDGRVTDASFLRLKNLYLSYSIPKGLSDRLHLKLMRIYFQGQNLWTITGYRGLDPERNDAIAFSLPPLSVYSLGIQLNL